MLPIIAVTDPADAELLFDVVNAELSKGGHPTEKTQRLCVLLIALYDEMNADNRETTS